MPGDNIQQEKESLRRIAGGDEAAFTVLFDTYKDKVYTIVLRLTASAAIAEEITQDVFLKIWLKRETLAEVEHFRAYLFTATRHHVFNALKRLARSRQLASELSRDRSGETNDTDVLLMDKEYQAILQEAIDRLPPRQQEIYRLVREQGMKREQVAEALRLSPQTVKQHLAQAMRSIRAFCVARLDLYIVFVLFETLQK